MIVIRNNYRMLYEKGGYGVGYQIHEGSSFDPDEVRFVLALLDCRRRFFEPGVVAIDGGTNIGVHTVEWSSHMHGWGGVGFWLSRHRKSSISRWPETWRATTASTPVLVIPRPTYFAPASFGSLEPRQGESNEFIGQTISYADSDCDKVRMLAIDSLQLKRMDLLKIDVEIMELEVLDGARRTIGTTKPILVVEAIKTDRGRLEAYFSSVSYQHFPMGLNLLAIQRDYPTLERVIVNERGLNLSMS